MVTRLTPERHDLIWGSRDTEPWYRNPEQLRTAEVWFPSGDLLVKFLFTTENLSIQVHPNDEQAQKVGKPRGKTEMWHILRAEPRAKLGLGLNREVSAAQLKAAALDGSIVDLLNWIPVVPGQTFFVPAGTVHAVGAGIALCEIQQLSDTTYRLFDWGRGRQLHLDEGVGVSRLTPGNEAPVELPVKSPFFQTERVAVKGRLAVPATAEPVTWIAIEGSGEFAGRAFQAGDVFRASSTLEIGASESVFLTTSEPP